MKFEIIKRTYAYYAEIIEPESNTVIQRISGAMNWITIFPAPDKAYMSLISELVSQFPDHQPHLIYFNRI